MALRINVLRYNGFVFRQQSPFFPVKTIMQEIYTDTNVASIFPARLARSCTKSYTNLASLALKMRLFLQDRKGLARILQEKIVR